MLLICVMTVICVTQFYSRWARESELSQELVDIKISLVVPATFEDYRCFSQQLMQEVAESTALPDEIILIVSGVPQHYTESIPLRIEGVALGVHFDVAIRNQAYNKNKGASLANMTSYSFLTLMTCFTRGLCVLLKRVTCSGQNSMTSMPFCSPMITFLGKSIEEEVLTSNLHSFLQKRLSTHIQAADEDILPICTGTILHIVADTVW